MKRIGVAKFRVQSSKQTLDFFEIGRSYAHFRNIYLVLRNQLFQADKSSDIYKTFIKRDIIRALVFGRPGGENKEKVDFLKRELGELQLLKQMIEVGSQLQPKNLYKLLGKIESNFKTFFTQIKKDSSARPPKPQKLSRLHQITIPIDQDCLSFKRKNQIRINLLGKMTDIRISHQSILKIVEDFSHVQAAELICTPEACWVSLIYHKPPLQVKTKPQVKYAGLDLGIINLASIYIDDTQSSSYLIGGKSAVEFNANSNRLLARYRSQRDQLLNKENRSDEDHKRLNTLKKILSKLYNQRREFFDQLFQKSSRRILELLHQSGVTDLAVSRNLGEAKQDPKATMGRKQNQKFHQIPILRLLDGLAFKSAEYGIRIHEIDEAYTSKASCLSSDINEIQQQAKESRPVSNVFNGKRETRSRYRDSVLGFVFHADVNSAVNHVKVAFNKLKVGNLQELKWKLANPILKNAEHSFLDQPLLI